MEKIKDSSLVFYVALEMIHSNMADSAESAFRIWPQRKVPATMNAVKIAFARIRGRGFTKYTITDKGIERAKQVKPIVDKMIESRLNELNAPEPTYPLINSVFALGGLL